VCVLRRRRKRFKIPQSLPFSTPEVSLRSLRFSWTDCQGDGEKFVTLRIHSTRGLLHLCNEYTKPPKLGWLVFRGGYNSSSLLFGVGNPRMGYYSFSWSCRLMGKRKSRDLKAEATEPEGCDSVTPVGRLSPRPVKRLWWSWSSKKL
jgi:hypothetical protein